MANAFVNGSQVASAMIGGLIDAGILINTVHRDGASELQAGKGDTINIRRPATGVATNFSGTASVSDHTTNNVAVTLNHQPYEQVQVDTADKALKVENFYREIVDPRVGGIAEYLEDQVAATLATTTSTDVGDATDYAKAVASAYEFLGDNKVPAGGRYLACSPSFAAGLLGLNLAAANVRGDGGAALQDAVLGRLNGFTVLMSSYIDDGGSGEPRAYAYHRTAVCAAFRTPPAPEGGASAATASAYGISARLVMDWSNTSLADVLTADTLAGFALSQNERAVGVQVG